jgi:type VI secretion system secreted protein Hcp
VEEAGELSLIKYIDSSSATLLSYVSSGINLKSATLTVVQTVNGTIAGSTVIDLRDVLITSVVAQSEMEMLTLSFEHNKVTSRKGGIVSGNAVIKTYLDIKGIAGDATDPGFEGQIEVLSYSWGATDDSLSLLKYIDSSSPTLFSYVSRGTPLKAATLRVVERVDGVIESVVTIDLRDVLITSVVTGGDTESITLSFQRSKVSK